MTQKEMIKWHLENYDGITTMEAFNWYGITRLAARIHELRQDGYPVTSEHMAWRDPYGEHGVICVYRKGQKKEG